jgi:YD repeat-containing protein
MRSQWYRLIGTLNKDYDINGLNPITTTTNYFYENTDHLQPTRVETTNSKGEFLKTETKYAHDVNDTRLINENRIAIPLESRVYKKLGSNPEVLLSNKKTIYSDDHNPASLYLPSKIKVSKGSSSLEDRVIYHSYDDKGNPIEVSKKDGTRIVYIWGYNKTQPIAKIENATLTNIASNTITSLQNLSNLDKDIVSENTLRTALNTLRGISTLSESQITTFTYNPLIGVTSITDPRGKTIYYEYDSFNRLQYVKDAQKNILKENKYNYKN